MKKHILNNLFRGGELFLPSTVYCPLQCAQLHRKGLGLSFLNPPAPKNPASRREKLRNSNSENVIFSIVGTVLERFREVLGRFGGGLGEVFWGHVWDVFRGVLGGFLDSLCIRKPYKTYKTIISV